MLDQAEVETQAGVHHHAGGGDNEQAGEHTPEELLGGIDGVVEVKVVGVDSDVVHSAAVAVGAVQHDGQLARVLEQVQCPSILVLVQLHSVQVLEQHGGGGDCLGL